MVENASDVQPGMEVYSADGQTIGKISHVWRDVPMNETGTASAPSTATTSPPGTSEIQTPGTPAMSPMAVPATGYFEVDHGGVLGIGATRLYVPFSAVEDLVRGDCLTLDCTKQECDGLYAQKPAVLESSTGM